MSPLDPESIRAEDAVFEPGVPVDTRSPDMRARAEASPYGDFEARATRVVARATGFKTVLQDDNAVPRTPDFRIENQGEVIGQGEVVTTAVGGRAAQLRAFRAGKLQFDTERLSSTWWVRVTARARQDRLERTLVDALSELEASGAHRQLTGLRTLQDAPPEIVHLEQVGLTDVICNPSPRILPGRIYGLPGGISGPISVDWDACTRWIADFLNGERCHGKLEKLRNAGEARQRHLYVGTTGDDPWSVHQLLDLNTVEILLPPPALPDGVTHLWLHGAEFPGRTVAWWPDRGWFDVQTRWSTV